MPSKRNKKHNGGGWFDAGMISPGNLVHNPYTGPGKDCPLIPTRPGFISGGLSGLSGGTRRRNRKQQKQRKISGGTLLGLAAHEGYMSMPGVPTGALPPMGPPPSAPAMAQPPMGQPMGQPPMGPAMGPAMAQPPMGPAMGQPPMGPPMGPQKGGRYAVMPGFLDSTSAIGASSYAPVSRIPCEAGVPNPLNPLYNATTAIPMQSGGSSMSPAPYVSGSGAGFSAANFPQVQVGAADSMRYNAPTAGYRNDFEAFPTNSSVGGLMINTPYDAKAFNSSCMKTGGGRRRRRQGGSFSYATNAAPVTPLRESDVMTRTAFDGGQGGLPVKYGGAHRHTKKCKHTHRRSHRRSSRRSNRRSHRRSQN